MKRIVLAKSLTMWGSLDDAFTIYPLDRFDSCSCATPAGMRRLRLRRRGHDTCINNRCTDHDDRRCTDHNYDRSADHDCGTGHNDHDAPTCASRRLGKR